MTKTGESYSTARMHILKAESTPAPVPPKARQGFAIHALLASFRSSDAEQQTPLGAATFRDVGSGETLDDLYTSRFSRYYGPVFRFFKNRGFAYEESHDLTQELPRRDWEAEPGRILINLPACHGPDRTSGVDRLYVRTQLRGLFEALREIDRKGTREIASVLVCGGEHLLGAVPQVDWRELPYPIQLGRISRKRFLLELRRSELLATQPGLASIYEARALGVTWRLLLPQSYDQHRIAMLYTYQGARVWPSASWTPPPVSARVGGRDESAAAFQGALERYMRVHSEDVAVAFEALLIASETGDVENVTGCSWDGSRQVAEHIVQRIESLPSPDRRQRAASHVR